MRSTSHRAVLSQSQCCRVNAQPVEIYGWRDTRTRGDRHHRPRRAGWWFVSGSIRDGGASPRRARFISGLQLFTRQEAVKNRRSGGSGTGTTVHDAAGRLFGSVSIRDSGASPGALAAIGRFFPSFQSPTRSIYQRLSSRPRAYNSYQRAGWENGSIRLECDPTSYS